MYKHILVALDNGAADTPVLPHVLGLARHHGSRLLLIHVADGYGARYFRQLQLTESEEMREDRAYLVRVAEQLTSEGLQVDTLLALGDPSAEILKAVEQHSIDLIVMGSHGHKLFGDFFHGSTVRDVRHGSKVPVLVIPSGR